MNISRKMAKNKTDEPVFVEPEFNEREYIVEEKERAKTTVFVFILGILSGLLEGFLEMNGLYYLSILLFILTLLGLFKILPLLKLRIPTRNSHKFYLFMMVLLTSILFWSVALNPPISVNTQPALSLQQYSSNSWISVNQSGGNYVLPVSSTHSNFSLRDGIYFANNINAVSFTSSISNGLTYCDSSYYGTSNTPIQTVGQEIGNGMTSLFAVKKVNVDIVAYSMGRILKRPSSVSMKSSME